MVELYGFSELEELHCFKMLISVSGVGPKAALSILSDINAQKFALCVATGDSKTLTKSKGIGLKIAQRIVLELKDKISKEQVVSGVMDLPSDIHLNAGNMAEAVSALVVLGYTQSEATQAVAQADPSASVEEMIKMGLKALASRR
ncbi:MAG: Holliday junction helicase RuvA [Oscillospiraceae bacterium]|nr:Holliday junction helicase RuvA [Oscillospiraceae bacterium]